MENDDFLQEEYNAVTTQKDEAIKHTNYIERNCLVLAGIIWAWMSTQTISNENLQTIGWYLPLFISLLSLFRVIGLNHLIHDCESYLIIIEKNVFSEAKQQNGWNSYRKDKKNGAKTFIGISAYLFWGVLLLACILVPVYCK